jgi:hypothetical protein
MVNGVKVLEVGGWRLENRSERSESKDPPFAEKRKGWGTRKFTT